MKEKKKFDELNDLQKLKVAKVLKYKNLSNKVNESVTILEDGRIKYIIVGDDMIDVN